MRRLRLYGGFVLAAALWLALAHPAAAGLHDATRPMGAATRTTSSSTTMLFSRTRRRTSTAATSVSCMQMRRRTPAAEVGGGSGCGNRHAVHLLIGDNLPRGHWRLQTVDEKGKNGEPGGEFFSTCAEADGDCDNTMSLIAVSEAKEAASALGIPLAVSCLGFMVQNLASEGNRRGPRSRTSRRATPTIEAEMLG